MLTGKDEADGFRNVVSGTAVCQGPCMFGTKRSFPGDRNFVPCTELSRGRREARRAQEDEKETEVARAKHMGEILINAVLLKTNSHNDVKNTASFSEVTNTWSIFFKV